MFIHTIYKTSAALSIGEKTYIINVKGVKRQVKNALIVTARKSGKMD
jgi:hypothetical protein